MPIGANSKANLVPLGGNYSNKRHLQPLLEDLQMLVAKRSKIIADAAPIQDDAQPFLLRRRLSTDAKNEIIQRYLAGNTTTELCAHYDTSKSGILKLLRDNGVTLRRQSLTPEQIEEASQLYSQGLAIAPIAKQLGVSFGAIHKAPTSGDTPLLRESDESRAASVDDA